MLELRISRNALIKYRLDELVFYSQKENKNILIREAAHRINTFSDGKIKVGAGLLYSVNLFVEIYKYVINKYREEYDKEIFRKGFDFSLKTFGAENLIPVVSDFITSFPPQKIYSGELTPEDYIWQKSNGMYNYEIELEELLLNALENKNKSFVPLIELVGDDNLKRKDDFVLYFENMKSFFKEQPKIKNKKDLITFLLEPIEKYPDNLQAQLNFIHENWKEIIGEEFEREFLTSTDLLREDVITTGVASPPPTFVPQYKGADGGVTIGKSGFDLLKSSESDYEENENFTPDTAWMPKVVMIAKNSFVWLSQLSKIYRREITRLDQVPDEELRLLASRNINSLWLIGVWERSEASKKIKHMRGNIDAVASAYSLYDYEIAAELGGYEAYQNLNERAKKFGIRLAADMVPNHTGIYSKWIIEHPDYFIQTPLPPFPGYKFTGENLSPNPDITIKIEDGYWANSDAAVVFERTDNRTGERRYIYHGNDGTNMPWNDTAQLDILKQEVREAVIQKILDVARKFSIIRFDAAMTLTKKHFSRLWYPEPGKGGDIPSRSDYALTKDEFNRFFPKEFWREVVDRINMEMPETLLLAEAFWLMEGYFVRTLGMHRVYNSAFMNMFMREENSKYRELIKNTLEFEPEILKRYVNFMSNPDEETAIKQFGAGDKYFGVLVMMITMPGLPMFAHGQIEGYHEKYGMEYKRAYYDEFPDNELIERHNREIFPLLKKRYLFSEVQNFWLFPFIDNFGSVNENVFAFTNLSGNEKAIVFYNNKYDRVSGHINFSEKKLVGENLTTVSLAESLNINISENYFIAVKELISQQTFLFSSKDFEQGFRINLHGFEYRIFSEFETLPYTNDNIELYNKIGKRGIKSLHEEKVRVKIQPIHEATLNLFDDEVFTQIVEFLSYEGLDKKENLKRNLTLLTNRYNYLLHQIADYLGINPEIEKLEKDFIEIFEGIVLLRSDIMSKRFELDKTIRKSLLLFFEHNYRNNLAYLILLNVRKSLEHFSSLVNLEKNVFDQLLFNEICSSVLKKLGKSEGEIEETRELIQILSKYPHNLFDGLLVKKGVKLSEQITKTETLLRNLLDDKKVQKFIKLNEYKGEKYYLKENYEELLDWFFTLALIEYYKFIYMNKIDVKTRESVIERMVKIVNYLKILSEDSGFRFEKLLNKF